MGSPSPASTPIAAIVDKETVPAGSSSGASLTRFARFAGAAGLAAGLAWRFACQRFLWPWLMAVLWVGERPFLTNVWLAVSSTGSPAERSEEHTSELQSL